ncbi:carbon-nitrogen hydrolase family protein [Agitococcus lubricus]|uniref:Putative amidohydrolase n=1 Tax=Agitococcus lubricus TaxID=1077255 RepID=A0A2T5ITP2_9GAMM|nr:carbon-nitrogen hydrolase family protein [Agitococcus lubricus]PTQ87239.1 putative amidohydrolase [Agitococcus lubricus]
MSVRVAAIQMLSSEQLASNLQTATQLFAQAKAQGACLVVLPENFAMFAAGVQYQTAVTHFVEIQQWLAEQAKQQQLWIIAGSIPCAFRPDGSPVPDKKVRSCCLVYNPQGDCVARYDKIHLFDVQVNDAQGSYQESATFEQGTDLVVVKTPFANIGLSICYDVRFPVLYQRLRDLGAEIIVVPAAFTYLTGQAHWQTLLRARAIETQCLVIGAGQGGQHNALRRTWGHSQIIDAWGNVLAEQQEVGAGVVVADYDLVEQYRIRQQMPLLQHRRLC